MVEQEHLIGFVIFGHVCYALGIILAYHAIHNVRTAQGTVAWCVALVSFPFVAIPLYLIFGRNKFYGYLEALRKAQEKYGYEIERFNRDMKSYQVSPEDAGNYYKAFEQLAGNSFSGNNQVELLINGTKAFEAIFEDIRKAQDYILLEFFIVRNDTIGTELFSLLREKALSGVHVYFIYDGIGSSGLPSSFVNQVNSCENMQLHAFRIINGVRGHFQINFRNHRKIVICDGKTAFVGGLNVGDEYVDESNDPDRYWRDTHLKINGPAVQALQEVFAGDYYWITRTVPERIFQTSNSWEDEGKKTLIMPISPADRNETGMLFFLNAIEKAEKRVWIASPYFVPDPTVIDAMRVAVLKGVDVMVIVPQKADHFLSHMAMMSFLPELEGSGIRLLRYTRGFAHQKVVLVDDDFASVGTATFDNRSMRLNFEVNALVADKEFAAEVEQMLLNDMNFAVPMNADYFYSHSKFYQLKAQIARMFAPIL